jgi:NADPH2:quinone reductase
VIEELGEDAGELEPGDRVMAALPHGGYAEEVVTPAANIVPIPNGMDFCSAAAFPVAYGTSHLALTHRVILQTGDVLLVHGAAGNVGRAAVEIGKRLGATVIATGGGPESLKVAGGKTSAIGFWRSPAVGARTWSSTRWAVALSMRRCAASRGRARYWS